MGNNGRIPNFECLHIKLNIKDCLFRDSLFYFIYGRAHKGLIPFGQVSVQRI